MNLPKWCKVERISKENVTCIRHPEGTAAESLASVLRDVSIRPGDSVAITVGSRGINDLVPLVHGIVSAVQRVGGKPFIIPAMGSHGGGTAEGQTLVLRHLGVTEESIGCPVVSSMETVDIGTTVDGVRVVADRHAADADHIILFNRVKPHTIFSGPYQSGLLKMMLIGLGKHTGATLYHGAARLLSFQRVVETAAPLLLAALPIRAGVAVIENEHEQTAEVHCLRPDEFLHREPGLLATADNYMPTLPYDDIDLLIIDEMGKNISGTGMDTNVLRRKHWSDYGTGEHPDMGGPRRVFVRNLTPETEGNAAGIGLADFTLRRVVDSIDRQATYANALTATRPRGAMIPMWFPCDRESIEQALASTGMSDFANARVVRIRNTLHLQHMMVSEPLLADEHLKDMSIGKLEEVVFDDSGMLVPEMIQAG